MTEQMEERLPEPTSGPDGAFAASRAPRKPMKYYIDFENVHGPGLKGVDALSEDDHVLVFYSQAAETFHIEHAIDLLNSKAKIEFIEIDGGTRNSLDFQLVAALFGTISDEYGYAIVSGDGGFDAAIKMGQRLELPEVVRIVNIHGDTELPAKPRTRRSRTTKAAAKEQSAAKEQAGASDQEAFPQQETEKADEEAQEQPKSTRRPRRRGGSRRSGAGKGEQAAEAPSEAPASEHKETHGAGQEGPAGRAAVADNPEKGAPEASDAEGNHAGEAGAAHLPAVRVLSGDAAQPQLPAASEQDGAHPESKPSNGNGSSRRRGSRGSGKSGKREDVAALLAEHDIAVSQQQLSTLMQALNGAKKRQDFYRRIIQIEKQEKGLALYREVRDYYEPLLEIVKS